jgi:PAS domain S-box-containing protein
LNRTDHLSTFDARVRLLVVGENAESVRAAREAIEAIEGWEIDLTYAHSFAEGLRALEDRTYDVALVDERLGSRTALDFLAEERVARSGLPVVLLTGSDDPEADLAVARRRAADHVARAGLTGAVLERSLRYAIEARRRTGAEARFRALIENSRDLISVLAADGTVRYVSPSLERVLGHRAEDQVGVYAPEGVHREDRKAVIGALARLLAAPEEAQRIVHRVAHSDGSWRVLESVAQNLLDDPLVRGIVVNSWDVTEIVEAETAVRQQRSELQERVKELKALYRVQSVLAVASGDWGQALTDVAAALPPAFRYPDSVAARVRVGRHSTVTEGFREGPWCLEEPIRVDGARVGEVEVGFVGDPPKRALRGDEDPFLAEERQLVQAVAQGVAEAMARRRAEQELTRSEAYFRAIAERSGVVVAVLNEEGEIRYLSAEAEQILGLPGANEWVGGLVTSLFQADDRAEVADQVARAVRRPGTAFDGRARVDGFAADDKGHHGERVVEYTARSLLDDPAVEGVVITLRDVTERLAREDQLRFQAELLEQVRQPVFAVDAAGRVIYWNDAASEVFQWQRHELLGEPVFERMVPPEHRELGEAARAEALAGRVWHGELHLRRKDGESVVLQAMVGPTRGLADSGAGRIVAGVDVTAQRKAVERIEFQAHMLEAVGQAVVATDREGHVIYWNRAAEELYGWSATEALGRLLLELTLTEEQGRLAAEVVERLERGESWSGEFQVRHRDGTVFPVFATGSPIQGRDGEYAGFIGISSDLRERRALEDQLRQAAKMEAIGRLAGGVAHDFNNLLTAIQGHAEFLMAELPEDSEQHADALEIHLAGRRAAELTRQLLTFSRKQVLEERVLDLGRILRELEPMLRRLLPAHIAFVCEAHGGPLLVRADAGQVQQVLLNLAVNAGDALEEGGRLEMVIEQAELVADPPPPGDLTPGPYIRLTVSDTGLGMTPDVLAHIYEPFFTTKPEGQGTGLGLSTVFGIVQQCGGHIEVESAPGEGSRFEIYLPEAVGVEAAPDNEGMSSIRAGRRETVLVVEDELAVRDLVCRILLREGYRVLEAANGHEALAMAESNPSGIHLVLSDMVMPEMGGVELAKELHARYPNLKVVLTSGYSQEALDGEIDSRNIDFLSKPFSPGDLVSTVRRALAR